jgi:hypothetical protein
MTQADRLLADGVAMDAAATRLVDRWAADLGRFATRWLGWATDELSGLSLASGGTVDGTVANQTEAQLAAGRLIDRLAGDRAWAELRASAWRRAVRAFVPRAADAKTVRRAELVVGQADGLIRARTGTWAVRVGEILDRGVMAREAVRDVAIGLREETDALRQDLVTQYDTALGMLAQAVATGDAAPTNAYLYVGPIDTRIRRWCLAHVGRVYRKATIDAMDNGQLPNTFITRGGYNCRHHWRDVTGTPLAALADSGRHASRAIAAQVDAVARSLPPSRRRLLATV